jgi:excisionase family DNA binding protein
MKLISVKEAATLLKISDSRVRQLILSKRLPAQKIGNSWAIQKNDIKLFSIRKTGRPAKSKIVDKHIIQPGLDEYREIWGKRDKDSVTKTRLEIIKKYFQDTGNVLYVWRAIQICNERDYPHYPDWVRKYLGKSAKRLLSVEKAGKKAPELIKNSIGIYGRDFSEIHHSWKKDIAYDRIIEERKKSHHKRGHDIYSDVGRELGISGETAKKYYLEVKKWREEIFNDMSW